ncbi:MAG: prepilin-type N-terminal cleavage/methylation domain-containing protein [Gemmatimonadaceae bacterium]
MIRRRRKSRKAFTLPEVLVTITLIAALAAVVVPAIASQLKKGDPSRVGSDVAAIRVAAEQFLTDVRQYPGAIQQITAPIKTTVAPLTTTSQSNYAAADVARWKGPYLTKDSIGAVSTGYGWIFKASFEVDTLLPTGVASAAAGQRYMMLKVIMPVKDSLSALTLDSQFDDGNLLTGSIRYRAAAAADTLKFLLLPIS